MYRAINKVQGRYLVYQRSNHPSYDAFDFPTATYQPRTMRYARTCIIEFLVRVIYIYKIFCFRFENKEEM